MLKQCTNSLDTSFTEGKVYSFTLDVFDGEEDFLTVDDDSCNHWVSADFLENNFVDAANGD